MFPGICVEKHLHLDAPRLPTMAINTSMDIYKIYTDTPRFVGNRDFLSENMVYRMSPKFGYGRQNLGTVAQKWVHPANVVIYG